MLHEPTLSGLPSTLRFVEVLGVPEARLAQSILALATQVLPSKEPVDLAARLGHVLDAWGIVALDGERVVGFKLGFGDRPGRFYSWLGGVAPEQRRRGVARELIRRQHLRCREAGYSSVRTHTTNGNRAMLLLNVQEGFDVIGTTNSAGKGLRIVLEKGL